MWYKVSEVISLRTKIAKNHPIIPAFVKHIAKTPVPTTFRAPVPVAQFAGTLPEAAVRFLMFTTGRTVITQGVVSYLAWRRIRRRELFKTQNSRHPDPGRGGYNKPTDEVKAEYTSYTVEDYERSVWRKLLRRLEEQPLDVRLNREFVINIANTHPEITCGYIIS